MTKDEFKTFYLFDKDEPCNSLDAIIASEIQRHEEEKWISYPDYPPPNDGTQIIILAKNMKFEYDTICIDARHIVHYMAIAWQPLPKRYKP